MKTIETVVHFDDRFSSLLEFDSVKMLRRFLSDRSCVNFDTVNENSCANQKKSIVKIEFEIVVIYSVDITYKLLSVEHNGIHYDMFDIMWDN